MSSSSDSHLIAQSRKAALMARILEALVGNRITGHSAKKVLLLCLRGDLRPINTIIKEEDLALKELPRAEYLHMAEGLIEANQAMAEKVRNGQSGKLMWFVGQMMREGKGSVEADKARAVLEELLVGNSS